MSNAELKPCPFCQENPIVVEIRIQGSSTQYRVGCPDNSCRGYWDMDCIWLNKKEAIEEWNNRIAKNLLSNIAPDSQELALTKYKLEQLEKTMKQINEIVYRGIKQ